MEIEINVLKIHYIEEGKDTKTSILLLHGWGASIKSFKPVINELSKYYKVYAIDFPGFGESEDPSKNYDVEEYSKVVLKFIEEKKLQDVVLIGHSFGGRVIIKLVGKLGFNPKKIILVDSAGIRPKKKKTRIIKEKIFKCIKAFATIIFGKEKAISEISEGLKEGYADTAESAIHAIYSVIAGCVNNKNK